MSYAPPGSAPTLPPPDSGARRALLATPGGLSVPLPSATEAAADFQSLPSSTLAAILDGLGLDTSANGNLRLLAQRRAELLRILGVFPNYARAALWLSRLLAGGHVAAASALQSLLPPAEAGFAMAAAPFDRLDGLDLREAGGDVSSPAPGSRATPFGAVIPLPPAPPPGSPAGARAQYALLQRLVASNN